MLEFFQYVLDLVESLGYWGLFVMTFLESTFLPIPSEVTLIPAGYLVSINKMAFPMVIIASILGTVGGCMSNYYVARYFGRSIFLRYGKYFFMTPHHLKSIEYFFERHGAISTFTGRLLPGIKHFISFPAGLAKMNIAKFIIYSAVGGAIWNSVLITMGYYLGKNNGLLQKYIKQINIGVALFAVSIAVFYWLRRRKYSKED